jgi:hypothetical protein
VAALCQALDHCQLLLRLELNHNELRDGCSLGDLIAGHVSMTRLALHGNALSGLGGAALFRGALANSRVGGGRLADIDVAWNGLSKDSGAMDCAVAIAEVLRESATLYHLDLSYNHFKRDCCAVIAEALRDNHKLYGLHMVGNAVTMDANGFLEALPSSVQLLQTELEPTCFNAGDPRAGVSKCVGFKQPSQTLAACSGRKHVGANKDEPLLSDTDILRDRDPLEQQSTCWACEGWECLEFNWDIQNDDVCPSSVWAFTSLDNFQFGLQLNREPGEPRFTGARMVPPDQKILVVYQVGNALLPAPDAMVQDLNAPVAITLRECSETKDTFGSKCLISVAGVAPPTRPRPQLEPHGLAGTRVVVISGPDGPVQMPRITETEFRARVAHERPKSILQAFKRESRSMVNDAFRHDWSLIKKNRLVPQSQESSVSSLLETDYGRVLALYRRLSAIDISGSSAFGVTSLEASSFAVDLGVVDGQVTKLSDVDRLFIAANLMPADQKKNLVVRNDRGLIRYQFLEFLLRIAEQHFLQPGVLAPALEDAVGLLLGKVKELSERRVQEIEYFFQLMHTDQMDDIYRKHLPILETVYHRLSLRARGCFVSHADFQTLLEQIGAYDRGDFQQRHSGVAFRMGMVTQADEYRSSRFQEMSFLEFLHALGAVVFLRSGSHAIGTSDDLALLIDDFFAKHLVLATAPGRVCGNAHTPETHGH